MSIQRNIRQCKTVQSRLGRNRTQLPRDCTGQRQVKPGKQSPIAWDNHIAVVRTKLQRTAKPTAPGPPAEYREATIRPGRRQARERTYILGIQNKYKGV
jgi:hypothetical protein